MAIVANDVGNAYHGWTNYQTWNVKRWIDYEYFGYCYWLHETRRIVDEYSEFSDDKAEVDTAAAVHQLARQLEAEIAGEQAPKVQGTYADLLNAALSEVNWQEIAEFMVEEVQD